MNDRSKRVMLALSCCLCIAGAVQAQDSFDLSTQIGPNPVLPAPDPALVTGMKVAKVVGWEQDQTPQVPDGLKVTAFARDLVSPRSVYTLPNGDVLVVQSRGPNFESITRPKDLIPRTQRLRQ